eukprot:TRINITY_DN71845_c0_g1_i1.p1 TRINITY_DN71845_c0_g1~~TRINITY_DN71845_c0_g1_i1.p1  ORF type:complete len:485 (+),score=184.25 TRINITY_DN71845_c0_g1_i1:69-1523(+)
MTGRRLLPLNEATHTARRTKDTAREQLLLRDTQSWEGATERSLQKALNKQDVASQQRALARVSSDSAARETRENSSKVMGALRRKVGQTEHVKEQLERVLATLCQEMHLLDLRRKHTVEQLTAAQGPLNKARHRIKVRRHFRPQRECVHDPVQEALEEESSDLSRAVDQLTSNRGNISRVLDQMAQCRDCIRADLADKVSALEVDKACLAVPAKVAEEPVDPCGFVRRTLQAAVVGATPRTEVVRFEGAATVADQRHLVRPSLTPPAQWRRGSEVNIEWAEELLRESRQLRHKVARYSRQAVESNSVKGERTRIEFAEKIAKTGELSEKLNSRVQELTDELEGTRRERSTVAHALSQKEQPLNACLRRLALRRGRPWREATHDTPEIALQSQLSRLVESCRTLQTEEHRLARREAVIHRLRTDLDRDRLDKEIARDLDAELLAIDPFTELSVPRSVRAAGTAYSGSRRRRRPGSAPASLRKHHR